MHRLVRLADELRTSAIANLAIGDVGLLAAAIRADHPGRAVALFAVVNVVLALVWGRFGPTGRIRSEAPRATAPPQGCVLEPPSLTRRRILVGLAPVAGLIALLVAIAPESAALVAGVPAGVGAGDLWMRGWARSFERDREDVLLRTVPSSPFGGGQRPVYTRPMNEATDVT